MCPSPKAKLFPSSTYNYPQLFPSPLLSTCISESASSQHPTNQLQIGLLTSIILTNDD